MADIRRRGDLFSGNGGAIRNSNGRGRGSFYFLAEARERRSLNRSFRRKTVAIGGSFRCFEVLLEYFPFSLSLSLFPFHFILFFSREREPIFSRVFSTTVPVEFLTVFPLSAEFSTGGASLLQVGK